MSTEPASTSADSPEPPPAQRVRQERNFHGDTFVDEYAWLADKESPETIAFLEAENAYTEAMTAGQEGLREAIFGEIKARTKETDLSVPSRKGGWWYYVRTIEGQQYPVFCRRAVRPDDAGPPVSEDGAPLDGEEVLLDGNELAGDGQFFAVGAYSVSPDGRLLAYSTDFSGGERFTLRVKDLVTGETGADEIPDTFYGASWSLHGTTLFYTTVDDAWRPFRVWRHIVGTAATDDVLVYEESDEKFRVGVGLTRSERFLVLSVASSVTSEAWLLDAAQPEGQFTIVTPRRQGVEYHVDHQIAADGTDQLLILHNDHAENFELDVAPLSDPATRTPLIPHRTDTRLLDMDAFADYLAVSFRRDGLTGVRILPVAAPSTRLRSPSRFSPRSPAAIRSTTRARCGSATSRWSRRTRSTTATWPPASSPCSSASRCCRCPAGRSTVPATTSSTASGRPPPTAPGSRSRWCAARGLPGDGSSPFLLYGYGSYEISMDPSFSISRLSLLDRGFGYAIAHIRGGGEMGRRWYEDGKLLHKKNTFTDFVACAEHLAGAGWTAPSRLIARGGSAGGLLMGAVANIAPQDFGGIVAQVPFVDALTTILDPSLPLTVTEWEEWGDPLHDAKVYAYMKSYSPYENVTAQTYPPIFAVTSLNDTRVLYREPAKWIAQLQAEAKGGPFLLRTEMVAGHGGRSGRYDKWREEALVLAWIVTTAGAPA